MPTNEPTGEVAEMPLVARKPKVLPDTEEFRRETETGDERARPLQTLTAVLEERYSDLAQHGRAVAGYSAMIARELGLSNEEIERIALAGELHDVGKVSVPEATLLKPGPLTDEEWIEVKRHPATGEQLLLSANLDDLANWVIAHHERPDGEGYPYRMEHDAIPLPAMILSVADSYDAMRTDRVYKAAMSEPEATAELREHSGTQFDEDVVSAFIRCLAQFAPGDAEVAAQVEPVVDD